jgi:uncharacterized protein
MRGFALFGIVIVNMMSFHSPTLYINPLQWWTSSVDHFTYILIDLFFQASFYPLFSLLFGYSLAIFRERVLEKKLPFSKVIVRRFCFLFVVGLIHAFFIWHGDILIVYAVVGFFSLPFLKMAPKLLLMFGSVLYLLANSLFAVFLVVLEFLHYRIDEPAGNNQLALANIHIYQQGTYGAITVQRIHDWMVEYNPQAIMILFFTIFPLFLMGAGFSKLRVLEKVEGFEWKWKKFFVWTFLLGFMFKCLPYIRGNNEFINYIQDVFGGSLQAVSYACLVVLLLQHKRVAKFLMLFSFAGKMSLTNYLMQSCAASLLFYGYGLQLFGKVSLTYGCLLAVALFVLQVCFCTFWLTAFNKGPMEWLWRSFTYLQFLKWKRMKER